MTRTVLIQGSAVLLGAHLVARRLAASSDRVVFAPWGVPAPDGERLTAAIRGLLRALLAAGPNPAADRDRLRCRPCLDPVAADPEPPGWHADEVWCLTGTPWAGVPADELAAGDTLAVDAAGVKSMLAALGHRGVAELNYVGSGYAAGLHAGHVPASHWPASGHDDYGAHDEAAGYRALERAVVDGCAAYGVSLRTFRTGLVFGANPGLPVAAREGAACLFDTLHDLVRELRERCRDYFRHGPLRWCVPAGGSVNLIEVGAAADVLVQLAAAPAAPVSEPVAVHHVVAPENVGVEKLTEQLGEAYEIPLTTVPDAGELTAVDRLFAGRLGSFTTLLGASTTFAGAGLSGDESLPTTPGTAELRRLRADQAHVARCAERHVAHTRRATRRVIIDVHGAPLRYEVAGDRGPVLTIVNELGAGLECWYRLVDRIADRYRVIMWAPRGIEPGARSVLLRDQVTDLAEILRHEEVRRTSLLGWCTGAKVAVEFCRRKPGAVPALVLLNGSFRAGTAPSTSDTRYERRLAALCHVLAGHPAAAESMLPSLLAGLAEETDLAEEADPHRLAELALARVNQNLAGELHRRFADEPTAVRYARQLLDYWSHDTMADAEQVDVPILCVGAERDEIASPLRFRDCARAFPNARYVVVPGATHYVMYDRPKVIARLVDGFIGQYGQHESAGASLDVGAARRG